MRAVNPELDAPNKSHRERVQALFGISSRVLIEAVGSFLKAEPGPLDHHNLRIIAAAAPHIGDPQLVAEMVQRLPITKMFVAARSVDLETLRDDFGAVLPKVTKTRVRQRLVTSLIEDTNRQVLEFCPPQRLTQEARATVKTRLLKLAKGTQQDQAVAVSSELSDNSIVKATLDAIEEKARRAEQAGETSRKLQLRFIGDALVQVIDRENAHATSEDVERAWRLVQSCEITGLNQETYDVVLSKIVSNHKLNQRVAHSVLDAIDGLEAEQWAQAEFKLTPEQMRSRMAAVPDMPESAAARAVLSGIDSTDRDWSVDNRWLLLRARHYGSSRNLLPRLSSDQVDRTVVTFPLDQLSLFTIARMTNPEALRKLAQNASQLNPDCLAFLIANDHTPSDVRFGEISPPKSGRKQQENAWHPGLTERENWLVRDPRLTDAELARIVDQESDETRRSSFAKIVSTHPSARERVFRVFLKDNFNRTHDSGRMNPLNRFVMYTADPGMHQLIVDTFDRYWTRAAYRQVVSEVAYHLMHNTHFDVKFLPARWKENPNVAELLRDDTMIPMLSISPMRQEYGYGPQPGYGPMEIARKVIDSDDDDVRRFHRVDSIFSHLHHGYLRHRPEAQDAILHLSEHGCLPQKHLRSLIEDPDLHLSMIAATDKTNMEANTAYELTVERSVASSASAVGRGMAVPSADSKLRTWKDLPDESDFPFRLPSGAEALNGQIVDGSKLELVRTGRVLGDVAEHMGNCLAGYEEPAKAGNRVIATVQTASGMIAVSWNVVWDDVRRKPSLTVGEINSRFNRNEVSAKLREDVSVLTELFNNGKLKEVEKSAQTEVVGTDDAQLGSADEQTEAHTVQPVRRPAPRRPLVLDHGPVRQDRPVERAPNALSGIVRDEVSEQVEVVLSDGAERHLDREEAGAQSHLADQSGGDIGLP